MNKLLIEFYIAMRRAEIEFMEEHCEYPPDSFETIFKKGWNMGKQTIDWVEDREPLSYRIQGKFQNGDYILHNLNLDYSNLKIEIVYENNFESHAISELVELKGDLNKVLLMNNFDGRRSMQIEITEII